MTQLFLDGERLREPKVDEYTVYWLLWFGAFFLIEVKALLDKRPGNQTLSEKAWKWGSIKEKGKAWRLRRLGLLVTLVWLTFHLLSGGKF